MKNLMIFFSLIIYSSSFYSCDKNRNIASYELVGAEKILSDFNEDKTPENYGELFKGSVYIRTASENRMAVFVDRKDDVDNLSYLLQMPKLENKDFAITISKAQILFLKDILIVNSLLDESLHLFKLSSSEEPSFLSSIKFTKTNIGSGLGRYEGFVLNNVLEEVNSSASTRNVRKKYGNPAEPIVFDVTCSCHIQATDCPDPTAGGPGASSCSVSDGNESCSVTCDGSNAFACCSI